MLEQLCFCETSLHASVPAASSQPLQPEDPLAGSDRKSVAGILPHRLTEQHILQLFHLQPCHEASRPVVSTEGKGFTIGAYAHDGGIVGLGSNTSKFRRVTAVLTRLFRQQAKNLTLTAIAAYQSFQFLTSSTIPGLFTSSSRLQKQSVAEYELRIPLENSNAHSMTAIFQDTFVNCQHFSSKLRSTAQCRVQGPTQALL